MQNKNSAMQKRCKSTWQNKNIAIKKENFGFMQMKILINIIKNTGGNIIIPIKECLPNRRPWMENMRSLWITCCVIIIIFIPVKMKVVTMVIYVNKWTCNFHSYISYIYIFEIESILRTFIFGLINIYFKCFLGYARQWNWLQQTDSLISRYWVVCIARGNYPRFISRYINEPLPLPPPPSGHEYILQFPINSDQYIPHLTIFPPYSMTCNGQDQAI